MLPEFLYALSIKQKIPLYTSIEGLGVVARGGIEPHTQSLFFPLIDHGNQVFPENYVLCRYASRGMCTPKGIELLEIQEELFRVSI